MDHQGSDTLNGLAEARALDKFYTKPEVALSCMDFLRATIDPAVLAAHDMWIEPSAGGGVFLEALPQPRIGIDISPGAPGIVRADFLAWRPDSGVARAIVIGNPPFGRNASLAIRFFNHAALFAERIALIVPRTFQKDSIQARLNPAFHLDAQVILPVDSFEFLGESRAVPTFFQIWSKQAWLRAPRKRSTTHPHFEFVDRSRADFAVQRVGVRAGRVKTDLSAIAAASHYFIKSARNPDALRDAFAHLDFEFVKHNTAGNPSISKAEMISIYKRSVGNA